MCGICGFNYRDEALLVKMLEALRHRGPDSEGMHLDGEFSLGMRRLSIIDIHGGQQPIWNEAGNVCVFLNGELYNYIEVRESLLRSGHSLSTQSDTEILVHLYEEHGEDCVRFIKGMFAFCIYDLQKNQLLLGRDRFGEKPLYYFLQNGNFAFASEIASLLVHPFIKRELNVAHLQTTFHFGFSVSPNTLFKNIFSLPPGHIARFSGGKLETKCYFRVDYPETEDTRDETFYIKKGEALLYKSVAQCMRSDVAFGAFLSGGIDSSSIAAIMQDIHHQKVDTFTVKFEESAYDESTLAREVSRFIGSHHHELYVPNQSFDLDLFRQMIQHIGQAFADSSAIPSYLVSNKISTHVRVALSGDGGDELFGGYEDFRWGQIITTLKSYPHFLRKLLRNTLQGLPQQSILLPDKIRGLEKAMVLSLSENEPLCFHLFELFADQDIKNLFPNTLFHINYPKLPSAFQHWSALRQMMWLRTQLILPEDMLVKIDRMSMCHSLEVRAPFLDADLFQYSCSLPDAMLIRKRETKYILRAIMKSRLPASVFTHPKQGFSLPLHRYFTNEFIRFSRDLIRPDHPLNRILDYKIVKSIIETGLTNAQSHSKESVYKASHKAWFLIQLYTWFDQFELELNS